MSARAKVLPHKPYWMHARTRGLGSPSDMYPPDKPNTAVMVWSALSTASMAVSAYHGYKRNDSVGWALGWGLLGSLFPVITPAVALAQGFGKRKAGR